MNNPIVYPNLGWIGRLGNALFQFAATLAMALNARTLPRFNEDWLHRPYFSVPDSFFGDCSGGVDAVELCPHIDERCRAYLQDVSLFERYLPGIRSYLEPSALARDVLEDVGTEFRKLAQPVLSVHVRRGDIVPGQDPGIPDKPNYFVLPSLGYYRKAIDLQLPDVKSVAVFSDEPEWCEEHFPQADYIHQGTPHLREHEPGYTTVPVRDWIDLQLMAQCERHVVSGSTYGIWGALLADSACTIRCSPVYGPYLAYIREDWLFPSSWQRLELSSC